MISASHRRRGFSLLEVVLAVTILGFGLAGMLAAASRCFGVARQARNYELSREALSFVEAENPIALVEDLKREGNEGGSLRAPYEGFRWQRTVEPVGLEEDCLFQVTMTILWSEEGREANESSVTYVYRPDQKLPGGAVR